MEGNFGEQTIALENAAVVSDELLRPTAEGNPEFSLALKAHTVPPAAIVRKLSENPSRSSLRQPKCHRNRFLETCRNPPSENGQLSVGKTCPVEEVSGMPGSRLVRDRKVKVSETLHRIAHLME